MRGSPESDVTSMDMNFEDTELSLGLPGEGRLPSVTGRRNCLAKRGFLETVDLNLESSSCETRATSKPPSAKAQVIGWPPVKSQRKKAVDRCQYVKVAVDGAPYLRKVDLQVYRSYQELLTALEQMFTIHGDYSDGEMKIVDRINGMEHVATYEDKDGDWMLVGDVPWKMFKESCKRIRVMKRSEAMGLAPRTPPKVRDPNEQETP